MFNQQISIEICLNKIKFLNFKAVTKILIGTVKDNGTVKDYICRNKRYITLKKLK